MNPVGHQNTGDFKSYREYLIDQLGEQLESLKPAQDAVEDHHLSRGEEVKRQALQLNRPISSYQQRSSENLLLRSQQVQEDQASAEDRLIKSEFASLKEKLKEIRTKML